MSIPVYRHNLSHDDWEVASVYDSDDCDSLGRSAYNESLHSSAPSDADHLYDDGYPHVRYSVPASYLQGGSNRPRLDAPCAPRGQNNMFIVPPPGVIFPSKERPAPLQDGYWPCTASQIGSPLIEPPPPSLLLSPSSPPRTPSPHIGISSPTTVPHVYAPHATMGTGPSVNGHGSVIAPTARYHDLVHTSIAPRRAETGCQAHPGVVMGPRKSGHDVLSPCPSYGAQSSEEVTVYGGNGGPGSRPDLPPLPSKYEHEAGRARWAQSRERRPSIWRRFVRRFSPSHVSVGQT